MLHERDVEQLRSARVKLESVELNGKLWRRMVADGVDARHIATELLRSTSFYMNTLIACAMDTRLCDSNTTYRVQTRPIVRDGKNGMHAQLQSTPAANNMRPVLAYHSGHSFNLLAHSTQLHTCPHGTKAVCRVLDRHTTHMFGSLSSERFCTSSHSESNCCSVKPSADSTFTCCSDNSEKGTQTAYVQRRRSALQVAEASLKQHNVAYWRPLVTL